MLHWRAGYCAVTGDPAYEEVPQSASCTHGTSGSWPLADNETASWDTALHACALRCQACPRCRIVSYSMKWGDCSWFHSCPLDNLLHEVKGFRTAVVMDEQPADASARAAPAGIDQCRFTLQRNISWGTPDNPDALGRAAQQLGLCTHSASAVHCCALCARTLACAAWQWSGGQESCCLRQWRPLRAEVVSDGTVSGILPTPCRYNCSLPRFGACRGVGGSDRFCREGVAARADASEVPWLASPHLAHEAPESLRATPRATSAALTDGEHSRLLPPRREGRSWHGLSGGARKLPQAAEAVSSPSPSTGTSVAVCVAGMLRTLTHPLVWGSLREHVLDRGQIDLFAVLGMAGSERSPLGWNDMQREGADAVRSMLLALAPRRTRFVNWEAPRQCGGPSSVSHLQFAKWSLCTDLIPQEAEYKFLLRTRPDVVWRAPLHLRSLAARMELLADDVVLTKNDYHMLWPRAQWHVLSRFRSVLCDMRCDNGLTFASLNEYCLMKAHLARHGIRHLEAKFPNDPKLLHFVSEAAWTSALRDGRERLTRWDRPPPQREPGTGIWCGRHATLGISCEACAMDTPRDAPKDAPRDVPTDAPRDEGATRRLRRCPVEADPTDLEWPERVPEEATALARRAYVPPSEPLWDQVFSGREGMAFVNFSG